MVCCDEGVPLVVSRGWTCCSGGNVNSRSSDGSQQVGIVPSPMARTAERPSEDDFAVETVLRPAELMLLDMWPGSESGTEDDVADDVAGMASLMWLLSPGMLRGSNSGAEEVEDIVLSMCKRMGCCKSSRGGSRSSRPLSRASGATGGDVAVCLSAFTSSYEAPACDQIMSSPSVTECLSYLARSVTAWWQTTSARTRKPIPLPRFLPAVCFHHHTTCCNIFEPFLVLFLLPLPTEPRRRPPHTIEP